MLLDIGCGIGSMLEEARALGYVPEGIELSNSLTAEFCVKALREAIAKYGIPEIFNTDQFSQFTDGDFVGALREHGIAISMDG